jgi:gas vesicle protein
MTKRRPNNMCERCNQSFLSGALVGGLVGGLLGVLYAPNSGKDTRKKLAVAGEKYIEKGEELVDEAEVKYDDLKRQVKPILTNIERKVLPILKEIETASEPVREEFSERIGALVDEAEGKIKEEKKIIQKRYFK